MYIKSAIIIIFAYLLDQASKIYSVKFFENANFNQVEILPFFNFVMVHNYGVSFGMFNDLQYGAVILSVITIIITIILLFWLKNAKCLFEATALSLIISGALGNLTDRIRLGYVIDFLDFYVKDYHWPAFNVADSAIFIGVVMIFIDSFFNQKNGDNNESS